MLGHLRGASRELIYTSAQRERSATAFDSGSDSGLRLVWFRDWQTGIAMPSKGSIEGRICYLAIIIAAWVDRPAARVALGGAPALLGGLGLGLGLPACQPYLPELGRYPSSRYWYYSTTVGSTAVTVD